MSAAPDSRERIPWAGVTASGLLLPPSRVHHRVMPVGDVIGELFSHVFLFGIVIALGVARAVAGAARRP